MKPYIAFGPSMRGTDGLPPNLAEASNSAQNALRNLHRMVLRNENPELAIQELAEIGSLAAGFLEASWSSDKHRSIVESVAARRFDFPVIHAGPNVAGAPQRDAMRKSLALAGTSREWAKAPGDESDLKRELLWFYMGVWNPGWLRVINGQTEYDMITDATRRHLLGFKGKVPLKEWTHAFDDYVTDYREDLLTADGTAGRYATLAKKAVVTYRIKDRRRAFFRFVRDQFRVVLKDRTTAKCSK